MSYKPSHLSFAVQSLLIVLFAFTLQVVFDGGIILNVVMQTYYLGGSSFLEGLNPFETTLNMGYPQFKYSPLFAVITGTMAQFENQFRIIIIWLITGMAAFSFGLGRWCDFTRKAPLYIAFAFHAAILDLVLSMEAYQVNALITGLILFGLSEYRDGRFFSAGTFLMLASNFKVFPVIFLIALALRFKPMYWLGAVSAGIIVFIFPTLYVGWSFNLDMHIAWFLVVFGDTMGAGVLDILSAFQRLGMESIGQVMRWFVMVTSIPIFFGYVFLIKRLDWIPWMTFGLASLLLLSPRTEVFTYVLLAPSYVFMSCWCAESKHQRIKSYGGYIFTILAVMIACCRFAYIDPFYLSNSPYEVFRVIGSMGYWILTAMILINEIFISKMRHVPVSE